MDKYTQRYGVTAGRTLYPSRSATRMMAEIRNVKRSALRMTIRTSPLRRCSGVFVQRTRANRWRCISRAAEVYAVNIETNAEPTNASFKLPSGTISTGLNYDDGTRLGEGISSKPDFSKIRIWFGDYDGNLWALDDHLQTDRPVWQVPTEDPNNKGS